MATYVFAAASSDGYLEEPIVSSNQSDVFRLIKNWFTEAYSTDSPDYDVLAEIRACTDLKSIAKLMKREGYNCWLVRIPDIHTVPPQLERIL